MGLIDTATKQLLPWRTRLWDDNLQFVGGVTRIYAGDIAPNDQYFVVTSGSGGDRPPISDTAVAYPIAGGDNVQPLWISRHFDSVYSVAITENAVYLGGHFSSSSPRPRQTRGPASTTSATAPARAWPATASATRSSAATTSARSTRSTGKALSGTRARTRSRATRPCWRRRAACSPAATPRSRAATTSVGSRSTTSTTIPAPSARTRRRSPRRSRAASSRRRAVHGQRHGDARPAASGGSRSRSRTATRSTTSRTT